MDVVAVMGMMMEGGGREICTHHSLPCAHFYADTFCTLLWYFARSFFNRNTASRIPLAVLKLDSTHTKTSNQDAQLVSIMRTRLFPPRWRLPISHHGYNAHARSHAPWHHPPSLFCTVDACEAGKGLGDYPLEKFEAFFAKHDSAPTGLETR